jgi:hypothetical protein
LGGELVEAKRREEANHALGDSPARFDKSMMLGDVRTRDRIETTPHSFEATVPHQSGESDSRDPLRDEISGSDDSPTAAILEGLFGVGRHVPQCRLLAPLANISEHGQLVK